MTMRSEVAATASAAQTRSLAESGTPAAPWYLDRIICDDALQTLKRFPDGCAHCIVTSPPYYGQRDYGHADQIGLEETPEHYLDSLRSVFRECLRVLSDCGTLWINVGDKYSAEGLLGLPWRLALSLKAEGWLLRSDIIWHKPNAMPSSVKNRFTTSHEYLFFFAKGPNYHFDVDAVREPHVTFTERSRMRGGRAHFGKRGGTPEAGKNKGNNNLHNARWDQAFHPKGRNRRTVWEVPLSKFRDAHFAVFPEALVEPCILAGSKASGTVLDPFVGSGTTAMVAQRLGRHYIGIDRSPKYCEIAEQRLKTQLPLI
jgi:site-specific DNA-methyltransferase (adenine-specific)